MLLCRSGRPNTEGLSKMVYEFRQFWRLETRNLLWLIGMLIAIIFLFQYVELPNSSFQLSVFSHSKALKMGNTSFSGGNSTFISTVLSDTTSQSPLSDAFEEKDGDSGSEGDSESSFGIDEDSRPDDIISSGGLLEKDVNSTIDLVLILHNLSTTPEKAQNLEAHFSPENASSNNNASLSHIQKEDFSSAMGSNGSFSSSPKHSPPEKAENMDAGSGIPQKAENFASTPAVFTVSDMYELLMKSHLSSNSMIPRWSSAVDQDLVYVKSQIENALPMKNDQGLHAPVYRNVTLFQRSYELMEQILKVYIYKEGERPVFHGPPLEGIYASEGWFMKLLEANKHFVTKKPKKAHLFYLPFSSRNLELALYVPNSHSHKNLIEHLKNYLDKIVAKYPFWNRTAGADHFLVACHDWAPAETKHHMANCIRALCNADVNEGFVFGKDASLPETYIPKARNPLRGLGGKRPSQRQTLAFFAGRMHGYVRPILLKYWGNRDPAMKIFNTLPNSKGNKNYIQYMKSSKYCICPRGYEVNSPRVVEAIFFECVPVIISDNFVPPFLEILNWESFAIFVLEKDIPNLKKILLSIPKKTYIQMQMRVKMVQKHFLWHPKPVKYDLFHTILHSIWYNRVFQFRPRL
ncbi:hypothetical protein Nepgr_014261 [Nepenthes gracilis]|uniref:Exostosin GT47 domain-containing protein n=1 Tax=Nepenthes gracilis TaxID=150966 RepID=A0AAD3XQ96_NEPGR|nr:hypothetical protein Nepgr_014261 [Nepenthes gracilis]